MESVIRKDPATACRREAEGAQACEAWQLHELSAA
jgi:hypothetical protein